MPNKYHMALVEFRLTHLRTTVMNQRRLSLQ